MPRTIPRSEADDDRARRSLRAKVTAERSHFLHLMETEPDGFVMLLSIVTSDNPKKLLRSLDPEVTRMVFQLAAMQCADIVADAGHRGERRPVVIPAPPLPPASPPDGPDALDQLRDLIDDDGRPFSEVAAEADMAPAQLYQFRTGLRPNPSIGTFAAILTTLGKTWADFA